MTTKNPWLGLASYEEPKNDGTDYQFCGRDEETIEMVRLIDNNLFVTLYGSSGVGKTSLLRAGVIPILRRKDYFPLYVRLSQEPKKISFAEAIVRKLQGCGLIEEKGSAAKHSDCNDRLFLWEYFATTRFLKEGREVYPVIILDQFEEVFREGDKAKAELLLKQIYLLLNDELEMPDEAGWSADTNYRFVASIREDFLFVLEDSIDENSLDLYKNNRYRLRPMKQEQARQVVLMPGKDCIEETEKDAVAERIITLAKRPQSDDIDTLLLSLVCAGTYDKKSGEKITLADLAVWKDNPMEVYYKDAVKGLTANQIRYIQQHFIRDDGSRRRINAQEAKSALGETTYRELSQGANRLFAIGDKGQVELLHDQLGMAVYEDRKDYEERERKKKVRRRKLVNVGFSVLFALIPVVFGIAWFIYQQNIGLTLAKLDLERVNVEIGKERDRANKERDMAEEAQASLSLANYRIMKQYSLIEQQKDEIATERDNVKNAIFAERVNLSRILAEKASALVDDGDSYMARLLALEALPPNLPYTPEAEGALRKACQYNNAILKGHTGYANSAVFSPNGKLIVSASDDKTVRIWDAQTGQELQKMEGHTSSVYSASFSPDGKRIVSSSWDNTVRIWDIQTGQLVMTLKGHTDLVLSAIFCPDGKRIVSASKDGTVRIWDIEKAQQTKSIRHDDYVLSAAFSPDGKQIVSVSWSKTAAVRIWNAETGQQIGEPMKGQTSYIHSAAFSPDGKRIVAASYDNTVCIWDKQGQLLQSFRGHTSFVKSASFSPDGKLIVSASVDNTVRIWDAQTGQCVRTLKGHTARACSAVFSSDGKRIVSASQDNTVRIWDTQTEQFIPPLEGHTGCVNSAAYSPNGKLIASASDDKTVRIWNAETGKQIMKPLEGHTGFVKSIAFSPDGKQIVSASSDSTVRLWDAKNGELLKTLKGHTSSVHFAAFSPNGIYIVSASDDKTVRIWDAQSRKLLKTLEGHTIFVQSASFSPDGKQIVSASSDNTVRVWDVQSGLLLQTLEGHTSSVYSASFSPDGKRIVSASGDKTIRIWDFPPLDSLIEKTRERFKNRPLTPEERRKYYLE